MPERRCIWMSSMKSHHCNFAYRNQQHNLNHGLTFWLPTPFQSTATPAQIQSMLCRQNQHMLHWYIPWSHEVGEFGNGRGGEEEDEKEQEEEEKRKRRITRGAAVKKKKRRGALDSKPCTATGLSKNEQSVSWFTNKYRLVHQIKQSSLIQTSCMRNFRF